MTTPEPHSDPAASTPVQPDLGADLHQPADDDLHQPADETQDGDVGKEAARYRRQLRAVEAERDTLRSTVETMQKQIVEDIARRDHRVVKPDALWNAEGFTVADLLGDDGRIDAEKVGAAVTLAVEALGLRQAGGLPAAPNAGRDVRSNHDDGSGGWSRLLSGKG